MLLLHLLILFVQPSFSLIGPLDLLFLNFLPKHFVLFKCLLILLIALTNQPNYLILEFLNFLYPLTQSPFDFL